jgi:hypothetical protein
MLAGTDFWIGRRDLALLVDQVADAAGVTGFGVSAGAIGETNFALGVAQQFETEVELFGECRVLFDGIETDTENRDVIFLEIGIEVTEPATFGRSTRGVGFRIEPEQDLAAPQ